MTVKSKYQRMKSYSLFDHIATLFIRFCVIAGVLLFALLSFGACSEGNHPVGEPEPIVSPGLELILPNTIWESKNGQPDPVYRIQFRDNRPIDSLQVVCFQDTGAGDSLFHCDTRRWSLFEKQIIQYTVDLTGHPMDSIIWRVDDFSFDFIQITPILSYGEGTPQRLDRQQ
jgi:hypothetical protein